jgi:DnaJ-class molecular chaperone
MDTTFLEYYTPSLKKHILDNYNKGKNELRKNHYFNKNIIDKVSIESESRAIVMTKELSWKGADTYEENKYVFSKQGNKWFIEDILKVCWNCKGVGEAVDYRSGYPYINRTCKYCNGTGWQSQFYIND